MNFTKDSTVLIFRDWRSPGHRLREARDKKLTLMVDRLILTNIISNLDKYYKQFLQISFAIWTNMNSSLDKYNLQFGQMHPLIECETRPPSRRRSGTHSQFRCLQGVETPRGVGFYLQFSLNLWLHLRI